ncbi:MAG: hypothetical protein KC476_03040 [Cyanobacteria bacterium HKST-UBA06]|nr:hypothetical protein [Cyanobacteria bacterium HKST-UBA05]MCA9798642.1 hypothetical protein [Cyanobacteria bacterium HKST-UBA04]MCA9806906.1 hypothetical protein [Cyanobacteria bacterium HKST-UBA06]MCA9841166.1 hypothetical protein [Cyanobacteria bacterium HKST-UBA03]
MRQPAHDSHNAEDHDAIFTTIHGQFASPQAFDASFNPTDSEQTTSLKASKRRSRRLMSMLRVFVGQTTKAMQDWV